MAMDNWIFRFKQCLPFLPGWRFGTMPVVYAHLGETISKGKPGDNFRYQGKLMN